MDHHAPERPRTISRKDILRAGAGGFAGLLTLGLPGCSFLSTDPGGRERGKAGAKGPEAPALASKVKKGSLSPVKKRLPEQPIVVDTVDRTGVYGGDWTTVLQGSADTAWPNRIMFYDYLLRWDADWKHLLPNLAERFEANSDGTEYTFTIRRGVKWSDGEPFTVDDIVFAQNDVLNNTDLWPVPPWPAKATKVDEHTVRLTLDTPDGLFLQRQATALGIYLVMHPKHYAKEFHGEYNKAANTLAKQAKLEKWTDLYAAKIDPYTNPDLPVLFAWKFSRPTGTGTRAVAERNPYYWKVDKDGSQLPYIDRVVFDVIAEPEVMVTRAVAGDIEMHCRHFNILRNKPVLAAGRKKGGYDFFNLRSGSMNHTLIQLNLTHKDPVLRQIFGNKDFRIGLSHAINRQEVIDAVFQKQGEPWQCAPRPESELFDKEMAKQYTEYDVDLANHLLDKAGLTKRDSRGRRLRPDGKPLAFSIEFSSELRPEWGDTTQMISAYWKKLGLEVQAQPRSRALWTERVEANQHDVVVWQGDQGAYNATATILEPFYFFPQADGSRYAVKWTEWYLTKGKSGEEPPASAKRQMALYDQILGTTDRDRQLTLIKEILRIAKEEFRVIGVGLEAPGYGIVRNDFHNVPKEMIDTYTLLTPGPTHTEQYFIDA